MAPISCRCRQEHRSEDGDVWHAEYTELYDDYASILGTATCQRAARQNSVAWRSILKTMLFLTAASSSEVRTKREPRTVERWNRETSEHLDGER